MENIDSIREGGNILKQSGIVEKDEDLMNRHDYFQEV